MRDLSGILKRSLMKVEMTKGCSIESDSSLWVERLCEFFRCRTLVKQPEARGQEKLPARCPRMSPLGLESIKV
ncbi:hypothetical protein A3841_04740 [Pontibacter flavimaris]|uniref:Uncharacterized protein n=1 Tax=Pontibacter flavimaris TaxID=1797110 RepID=A0A1Q5P9D0_9BACT|nr:hypothetical protein A3841_04740 [Pontibacter flavimaris]